jgi:hypothetical protein
MLHINSLRHNGTRYPPSCDRLLYSDRFIIPLYALSQAYGALTPSVRPSVSMKQHENRLADFHEIDIREYYQKLSSHFSFHLDRTI